jgi:molybdopterin converting factor small subunit
MDRITIRSTYAVGAAPDRRSGIVSGKDLRMDLHPGSSVEDLLRRMPELGPPESYDDMMLCVFVNGKRRGLDHVLKDGDVLDFHIPSSGG